MRRDRRRPVFLPSMVVGPFTPGDLESFREGIGEVVGLDIAVERRVFQSEGLRRSYERAVPVLGEGQKS